MRLTPCGFERLNQLPRQCHVGLRHFLLIAAVHAREVKDDVAALHEFGEPVTFEGLSPGRTDRHVRKGPQVGADMRAEHAARASDPDCQRGCHVASSCCTPGSESSNSSISGTVRRWVLCEV